MKQFIILVTFVVAAFAAKVPVDHVGVTVPAVGVPDHVKETTPHNDKDVHHTTQHPVHHGHHGTHGHDQEQKVPHVPQHVQHVVEQVHQHIPQVVNHHVGVKKSVEKVPQVQHVVGGVGVPHVTDKVTVPTTTSSSTPQHHVHVDVIHHHADGNKHVAHNVPQNDVGPTVIDGTHHQHHPTVPQVVVDKVKKVEQHVQQVMQQAHQHIPQVINHHIAQKQKQKEQHVHHSTTHSPNSGVVDEKVPHGSSAPVPVPVPVPETIPGNHVESGVHHPVVAVKTTTM